MPRFCAAWHDDITTIGGVPQFEASGVGLGLLPKAHSGGTAAYHRIGNTHAVGEVTLFDVPAAYALLRQPEQTMSHAELLLAAFIEHGTAAFERISGAFSLVIWHEGALWLVRDPAGMRTLFYARAGDRWLVSDSLYDLRRWPALPSRLDYRGVAGFLTFAYIPGADTLLAGYREMLPGQVYRITNDDVQFNQIGTPDETVHDEDQPVEAYAADLRADLEAAMRGALPVGAPAGVTLSGGVDSSLVTALAAQLHTQPVYTYALNFGATRPSEQAFSSLVAAHCGTRHQLITVTEGDIARYFARTMHLLDAPVGDPLTVPNYILARAAADDGLPVLLNGEGGDPLFGGPKNIPMLMYEFHRTDATPEDRYRAYLRSYRKCYRDLPDLLTPAAWRQVQQAAPLTDIVAPFLGENTMRSYVNKLMWANTAMKGAHHILPKVARLVGAHGMEPRSPLFDSRIIARSFAIPPAYKLHGTTEKWILKQAVQDLLPAPIIARPKSGMRVPVRYWLGGVLQHLAQELLFGKRARSRDLLQPALMRDWLANRTYPGENAGVKLWLVLSLEMWLRLYLDGDDPETLMMNIRPWWRRL